MGEKASPLRLEEQRRHGLAPKKEATCGHFFITNGGCKGVSTYLYRACHPRRAPPPFNAPDEQTHSEWRRKMKIWKNLAAVVAVLVVVALGFVSRRPVAADEPTTHVEQMIAEAKTLADHEALAASYDKEAQEARQKQAEHQQMGEEYAKIPVLKTKTGAVAHCQAIAKKYEEIAKENEALAQMHRDMAKVSK